MVHLWLARTFERIMDPNTEQNLMNSVKITTLFMKTPVPTSLKATDGVKLLSSR